MAGFRFPYRYSDIARLWPEMETAPGRMVGRWEQMIALLERKDQAVEDFLNTSVGGGKEYATVIVAGVGTHQSGKDSADYVFDGTAADCATMQAIFDNMPDYFPGFKFGTIVFLEGSYGPGFGFPPCSLVLPGGFFTVKGQGFNQTQVADFRITITPGGFAFFEMVDIAWAGTYDDTGAAGGALIMRNSSLVGAVQPAFLSTSGIGGGLVMDGSTLLGKVVFTAGGSLALNNSSVLHNVAGDEINAVVDQIVIANSKYALPVIFTANVPSVFGPSPNTITIDGFQLVDQVVCVGSGFPFEYLITVDGFGDGHIRGLGHRYDSLASDSGTLDLINTWRINVASSSTNPVYAGGCNDYTTVSHIRLSATAPGLSSFNMIDSVQFDGDGAGSFTGMCHIEIGAGVEYTKIGFNHWNHPFIANVCDSGSFTEYVVLDGDSIPPVTERDDDAALFFMLNEAGPADPRVDSLVTQVAMIDTPVPIPTIPEALIWMGL